MLSRRLSPALLLILMVLGLACSSNNNTSNASVPVSTVPPAASVAAVQTATPVTPTPSVTPAAGTGTPVPTAARVTTPTAVASNLTGMLTVFAAASLTDAFNQLGDALQKANPGLSVKFNFASSSALRTQLSQGAKADLFASADQPNMNGAKQDGSIDGADQLFAKNKLVVITPRGSTKVASIQDLAKLGLNFVLTDPSVPIGNYARQALTKIAADPTYGAGFDQKVLANLKSQEADVKAVVSKVQLGEADAAISYATDVTPAASKDVNSILIPDQFNVIASYPIAVVKDAPNKAAAQAFIAFVRSAAGQAILKQNGFIVDADTGTVGGVIDSHHPQRLSFRQAGGFSQSFTLAGALDAPATIGLADLQAMPSQTIDVQYLAGVSPTMKSYIGVSLYDLVMAANPRVDAARKNDLLRFSVLVTGSDGYQALIAWGEIDPGFEGKAVLIAYADGNGQPLGADEGMARLVVPGDQKGGRYVSNVASITLLKPAE